jgi:outer membrane receptor protein involved in Fe transport
MMWGIRRSAAASAVLVAMGLTGIARADQFNISPGRLGEVAAVLGVQAGVTITVTETDVAAEHSPGVNGNLSLREALDRVLLGTGTEALFYDPTTIRIVRKHAAPPAPVPVSAAVEPTEEVVVTASKQTILLDSYPGSVKVVPLERNWVADKAAAGTGAIAELLPILSSTNLGPGRDKLFIRGIADSSFNGPTQATVGQYLGDVRLNYNAPDPDLNLYDMNRVEVLVGPQGTLYGAGSLGGVIRLVPNEPDAQEASVTAAAGLSSTRFGGISWDTAAVLNEPLISDRLALRLVAYGARDAGYIDDVERGLHNINSVTNYGGRMILRAEGLSDWTLDFGALLQNIDSADSQYTLRGDPPLTRRSNIAQPFFNNYRVIYISARRAIGDAELVSTTSTVWHDLTTQFDATGSDGTTALRRFEENNEIQVFSHETRVTGGGSRTPWVAGVTTLFSSSLLTRTLGSLEAPVQIDGVANVQADVALFGQISYPFTSTLTGTIGERFDFTNAIGVPLAPADESQMYVRSSLPLSTTLGLDWHPGGSWSAFFHYQQGYRPGGLAVTASGSGVESQTFQADALNMDEIGIRYGHAADDPLLVRSALFAADWNHMQADLVDLDGLPYTTNIGRGRIYGIDADITWRLSPALTLSASAFVNDSRLVAPAPEFDTGSTQRLPDVARDGARVSVQTVHEIAIGGLSVGSSLRYVGRSTLGVGQHLDIPQGNYCVVDADVRLALEKITVSANLDNIGDVRANTFSFGNPFSSAQRDQMTPLRPRTLRLGISSQF